MPRNLDPIYAPGTPEILGYVPHANGGSGWSDCREALSEILSVCEDDISAPDLYWGGEHGDENRVDGVVVNGEILATFRPLKALELAAIYANPENSHAKLTISRGAIRLIGAALDSERATPALKIAAE